MKKIAKLVMAIIMAMALNACGSIQTHMINEVPQGFPNELIIGIGLKQGVVPSDPIQFQNKRATFEVEGTTLIETVEKFEIENDILGVTSQWVYLGELRYEEGTIYTYRLSERFPNPPKFVIEIETYTALSSTRFFRRYVSFFFPTASF